VKSGETVLEVRDLGYEYKGVTGSHKAIDNLTFSVRKGEFVSIVGPSGSGKSTLLKLISGLLTTSQGTINVAGNDVKGKVPSQIAVVFQDYSRSLFPWMTVQRNIEFPLRGRQCSRREATERSKQTLAAVGLSEVAHKYPWQLSGGMQQRVAIARALAYRPELLLMDEPLASVDAQTRADLEDLVLAMHAQFKTTVLFVTHDIDESVYLSDRVLILSSPPARLLKILPVNLDRPRHQVKTRESSEFVRLRSQVADNIFNSKSAMVV
jgi:NitT/TauT family transport system ATP-binding protein